MDNILIIAAHPDDDVIGVGGSAAKYAAEGAEVVSVILSYGEKSHPWLRRKFTVEIRVAEAKNAAKIVGIRQTVFFGLEEGKFIEVKESKDVIKKLSELIMKSRPAKIFTHSCDDPHPDHKATFELVSQALDDTGHRCDLYTFDIWNIFLISHRDSPKLSVDITETFSKKIKAMKEYKSQRVAMFTMIPAVYSRAIVNGLNKEVKYAEIFVKMK